MGREGVLRGGDAEVNWACYPIALQNRACMISVPLSKRQLFLFNGSLCFSSYRTTSHTDLLYSIYH